MRKKFYLFCLVFLLIAVFTGSIWIWGQQARRQLPPISVHKIKGNIYEVKGEIANCGFFIGEKEVVVIDAKMTDKGTADMLAEIKKLTANPVKTLLLTHSDGDHVNGIGGFPAGLAIVAQENTKKHMDKAFTEAEKREYLPNKTFSDSLKLQVGKKTIRLYNFGPAHTDGDAVILFPEEKTAFVGDLVFLERDPLIHRHKNGNSFGLVKTLKAILKLDADTFVHGHGDVIGKKEIEKLAKALEDKQAKIKKLIAEKKSLQEIKKIFNVKDQPRRQGRPRRLNLVEIIYLELTEG